MDSAKPTIWCRQGNITRRGSTKREALPPIMVADWFLIYGQAWSCSGGRKIEWGPREGRKKQFIPRFYCWPSTSGTETAGWLGRELRFSCYFNTASQVGVVKFMNYPSSVQVPWTLQWIKFRAINVFVIFALRSSACLSAGWAISKQLRDMSKEKKQRWNLLLEKQRVYLGS